MHRRGYLFLKIKALGNEQSGVNKLITKVMRRDCELFKPAEVTGLLFSLKNEAPLKI